MPSGLNPHTHAKVVERRHQAATMYLRGEQQYEIARRLGVSQQQVSADLKAMRALWLESSLQDFDARKSQELAKIDEAEVAYWTGWQRSLRMSEVSFAESSEGGEVRDRNGRVRPKAPSRKATLRKEEQAGDPRFLDGVLKCIERRCKILGIDAPDKIAPTNPAGDKPWSPPGGGITEEFYGGVAAVLAQYGTFTAPGDEETLEVLPMPSNGTHHNGTNGTVG